MPNLKQTDSVSRITPSLQARTPAKRQHKGDFKRGGQARRTAQQPQEGGHKVDEYA